MADRTHLKVVDTANLSEDDPFAELTRIMGFDPREPVRQNQAPQQLPPLPSVNAASAPRYEAADEDLEIDLERELMGELDATDLSPFAQDPEPYPAEPEVPLGADDDIPELHLDLAEELDNHFEPVAGVAVGSARADESAGWQDEGSDLDLSAAFDAAMLETDFDAPMDPVENFAPAAVEPQVRDDDQGLRNPEPAWTDTAWEEAPAVEPAYAAPVDPEPELEAEIDLDLELDTDEMEEPLEATDALYDNEVEEPYVRSEEARFEPQPAATAAPRASFEDELKAMLGGGAVGAGLARSAPRPEPEPVRQPVHVAPRPQEPVIQPRPQVAAKQAEPPRAPVGTQGLDWMLQDHPQDGGTDDAREDPLDLLAQMVRSDPPTHPRGFKGAPAQPAPDDVAGFDADAFGDALHLGMEHDHAPVADPVAAAESVIEEIEAEQVRKRPDGRRDPLDIINSLTAHYGGKAGKLFYGRATPVAPREPVAAKASSPEAAAVVAAPAAAASAYAYSTSWKQPPVEPEPVSEFLPAVEEELAANQVAADDFEMQLRQDFDDIPDIETVDVADRAIAMPEDLDIPDVPFDEDRPAEAVYDDLDAEFAGLLNDMNANETAEPVVHAAGHDAAAFNAQDSANGGYRHDDYQDPLLAEPFDLEEVMRASDDDSEAGLREEDAERSFVPARQDAGEDRPRRGLLIAAAIGGVALIGAVGAYALSFGGGGSDVPVLVSADQGPVKVRPENPGGTRVPNQNNQVYDAVSGVRGAGAPQQERLVTTTEEPMEVVQAMPEQISADSEDELAAEDVAEAAAETPETGTVGAAPAGAKNEDRISQIVQEAEADPDTEIAAVAPRRVRTMVVRPDGTLAPREEPAPVAAAAPQPVAPAVQQPAPARSTDAMAQMAAAQVRPEAARAPVSDNTPARPAATAPRTTGSTVPNTAPIAPQRPSAQPVQVVGEVKPDRVAAISGAEAGGWAMQIASQPTEEAARSSYQALARRYGNVLNGREVNIVRAEIEGRGTFWRVRVGASDRNEAIRLCESYKSAGGTCFVSR